MLSQAPSFSLQHVLRFFSLIQPRTEPSKLSVALRILISVRDLLGQSSNQLLRQYRAPNPCRGSKRKRLRSNFEKITRRPCLASNQHPDCTSQLSAKLPQRTACKLDRCLHEGQSRWPCSSRLHCFRKNDFLSAKKSRFFLFRLTSIQSRRGPGKFGGPAGSVSLF